MTEIFSPPFSYTDFIDTKKIKKLLIEKDNLKKIKIAILQGSTVDELKNILELFLLNDGFEPIFYVSDYNRYYEETLFPNEKLNEFSPDIAYLHITNKNITKYPIISDSKDQINEKIKYEIDKFESIWQAVQKNFSCHLIQNNFEYPFTRFLGSYDTLSNNGGVNYINKINDEFSKKISSNENVYLNDINYLSSKIGLDNWFDSRLWYSYKSAVSYNAIPYIAHNLTKIILSIYGGSKKLLITDLDNTVWGGVIGDVGEENILVGQDTPESEAYYDMQAYLKDLKSSGILLATCSKNEETTAKQGIMNKSSLLELEDFSSFKANWNSKDLNVANINDELNLSMEHSVFIDDNPVERDIVSSNLPKVSVPKISDVSDYVSVISSQNYFERKNITNEDLNRVKYYEQDKLRKSSSSIFENYSDYLSSLKMVATFSKINNDNFNRVVQLINKTNQFNPTTKRYSGSEIENIMLNNEYIALTARLVDKYGDNGLVSIAIIKIEKKTAHIDLWVMSCRVFQRGLEQAMFDKIIEELESRNIEDLTASFYPTKKNMPVKDLFKVMGFTLVNEKEENTSWKFKILPNYKKKNSNIIIENIN